MLRQAGDVADEVGDILGRASATGPRRLVAAALAAYRSAILVSASRALAVDATAAMPRNSSTSSRSADFVIRIMAERLCGILHPRYELIHMSSVEMHNPASAAGCGSTRAPVRADPGALLISATWATSAGRTGAAKWQRPLRRGSLASRDSDRSRRFSAPEASENTYSPTCFGAATKVGPTRTAGAYCEAIVLMLGVSFCG
jgi:hypothetical protein